MIGETMERIKELTEEMGQCLEMPVKITNERNKYYNDDMIVLWCDGKELLQWYCYEDAVYEMANLLDGMRIYKMLRGGQIK